MVQESVGQRVRRFREGRGLSQEELGKLAGLHRVYIARVENGSVNPSAPTREKLAKALRLYPAQLDPAA
jgi:transcriptional regulator with XRE-family HTH domain